MPQSTKKAFALRLDRGVKRRVERLAAQDLELGVDRAQLLRRQPLDRRVERGIEAEGKGFLVGRHEPVGRD